MEQKGNSYRHVDAKVEDNFSYAGGQEGARWQWGQGGVHHG